jgi:acyl-CoA thioesterase-1
MRILLVLVLCACGAGAAKKAPDSVQAGSGKGEEGRRGGKANVAARSDPSSPLPPPSSQATRKTVLIVGTSLTAGLGLDPEEAYPALLQRKADSLGLHVEIVNAGLSGETSAGAVRRMDWLLRGQADVVIIESGANDGLRGLDVDSTRANLRAIVAKVKAARPAARILLAQMEAPPNLGAKYTAAFRTMYQDVAREEGIGLMPFLLRGVAGVTNLNQQDGIHPNQRGEEIVANNVWAALEPVLRQLDATATAS